MSTNYFDAKFVLRKICFIRNEFQSKERVPQLCIVCYFKSEKNKIIDGHYTKISKNTGNVYKRLVRMFF